MDIQQKEVGYKELINGIHIIENEEIENRQNNKIYGELYNKCYKNQKTCYPEGNINNTRQNG